MSPIFLLTFLLSTAYCKPFKEETLNCGYDSCHQTNPDVLNVHLVPHSHNDLGWKKTMDQYYFGNNFMQHKGVRGVQNILDTVVQSLQDNPDRRFIQVETANFARWWNEQSDEIKNVVKSLVNNGQLEMVSGGWSMNDEATTNYQAIIDQFTLGLRTLNDTLGTCAVPRVGWQIDSFGHSSVMAQILAQLGFDGVFLFRVDYRDYLKRVDSKTTEFIWRGNSDLDSDASDIFTSLLYNNYSAPYNFCFDLQCGDLPIIDDKNSFDYNVEKRVEDFAKYIWEQKEGYPTKNILITMGGDFTYGAAHIYYTNIDKLIKGFKEYRKDINIMYSTPSCYIKAVNEEANRRDLKFSVKTDDFMPYASDEHSYWTGFYSSRPTLKRLERLGNNLLQVIKQLAVHANAFQVDFSADLIELKSIMGILQHHDAITGTEKQHVSNDYTFLLTKAMFNAQRNVHAVIFDLLKTTADEQIEQIEDLELHSCLLSNVSRCIESNLDRFTVAVYNPNGHVVSEYIRLPVKSNTNYNVQRLTGESVPFQVGINIESFDEVPGEKSPYELVFYDDALPALGVHYFYVIKNENLMQSKALVEQQIFGSDTLGFRIDDNCFLESVVINGETLEVKQEFLYYLPFNGDNMESNNRSSGAYIFRPRDETEEAFLINEIKECSYYKGELFEEVHQKYNEYLKQVIRVYKSENYIEFDWIVGPLEYPKFQGIELISRFTTNMNTGDVFYTDSNGRQLIKRVRNYRETFEYSPEEPISSNYYPITSRILIRDETKKRDFVIHTDRAQGGSSLKSGQIELMLHRRLVSDDAFGVDEALNEIEFKQPLKVRGKHYLHFGDYDTSAKQQRNLVQKTTSSPWVFVGNATNDQHNLNVLMTKMIFEFSGIRNPLPENVNILTLEQLSNVTLLLRLEHLYSANEHSELSESATVDLKELFALYDVTFIKETTLGANQLKNDNHKLTWKSASHQKRVEEEQEQNSMVTLKAMEIKTFIITVESRFNHAGSFAKVSKTLLILIFTLFLLR